MHIVGNRRWNRRGAMVTDRYQHVGHHEDVADLAAYLRDQPGGPVAAAGASTTCPARVHLETTEAAAPGRASCSARRARASPTPAREACDATFSIAQFGSTRSINASAAAAIAMHAWVAQHADRASLAGDRRTAPGAGVTDSAIRAQYALETLHADRHPRDVRRDARRGPEGGNFAFPAINVSSSQTLNAALQGFAEAGSDGIIQVSTGGAEYLSGPDVKNMVTGSVAFAAYAAEVAKNYPVNIALHTDHCPKDKLDGFVRPLLDISVERVARGEQPLFQSHMWDGSAVPLDENLEIAEELLATLPQGQHRPRDRGRRGRRRGGRRRGRDRRQALHTPEDALATVEALGTGENGRYLTALTFGNVHGVYKPGNVKLRPEILKNAQEAVIEKLGLPEGSRPFDLVFHGGSGSTPEEISAAVDYGVVKMNVDTDTQYAFTRPVAGAHVRQLRRRAQGRRRGRQQEGLRPARLGQGGRGRHGRAGRRGLPEPARGRSLDRLSPASPDTPRGVMICA